MYTTLKFKSDSPIDPFGNKRKWRIKICPFVISAFPFAAGIRAGYPAASILPSQYG